MTKLQLSVVAFSTILFLGLYFGFDIKDRTQKEVEQRRSLIAESTDISTLLNEAKEDLTASQSATLVALETAVREATSDSIRIKAQEKLSGWWYDQGQPAIAGFHAEQIAELVGSEEAWSIAGTTFAICQQRSQDEKVRSYCSQHAVKAFENAISLNPSGLANQVNLALTYTEAPPKDNPMKGILMLVELNKRYPENVLVLTNLGRLAIQTGQFAKAVERLQKAVELEPENVVANCLYAKALDGAGQRPLAEEYQKKCQSLTTSVN